jgi:hypothetical protein
MQLLGMHCTIFYYKCRDTDIIENNVYSRNRKFNRFFLGGGGIRVYWLFPCEYCPINNYNCFRDWAKCLLSQTKLVRTAYKKLILDQWTSKETRFAGRKAFAKTRSSFSLIDAWFMLEFWWLAALIQYALPPKFESSEDQSIQWAE